MATLTKPAAIASGLPDVGCYFACLAAYNSGTLHGAWVDLELISDAEDIQECIDWILDTSPEPGAEEWAMHDSAGLPSVLRGTEWPSLADLATFAETLVELHDSEVSAFRLYCDHLGELVTVEDFREAYAGTFGSGEDFAQDLAEQCGDVPEQRWPFYCIDWQHAWRELEIGGDYFSERDSDGALHFFRNI